ncbi:hypothetical protein CSV79_14950 [Sporosarcina sp. P13]|nr:hypothetical protein CSV79_14950 [Sporosarcina sp. P13]
MLNFLASWCFPCKVKMLHKKSYYEKYKNPTKVKIIAINMTTETIGSRVFNDRQIQ